jgi:Zn-dependent protease
MPYLIASLALCWATWRILRGGWQGARGFQVAGFDLSSLGMGVLAVGAAMYFWGVLYGIALIVAVVIHEFGHVAAFRVCGHADARFRLIPLMGGVAISNQIPASADKAFFITLMGPAINLGPMALCFALAEWIFATEFSSELPYQIGSYIYVQGMVLASLNFFNLLPLWPLDGGKLTQRLAFTFAPDLTRSVSIAMIGLAGLLCLLTQSLFLLFFVLMSWPGLMQSETLLRVQRPFAPKSALLALGAYLSTTAAFFVGGHPLLLGFF